MNRKKLSAYVVLMLLFMALIPNAFAQQKYNVKGTIVDETNTPMIGVAVVEKGTTSNGAVTDINGQFSLNVASPQSEVVISYIGYQTMNYIASSTVFNSPLQMALEATKIDDVVVIGYGTVKKSDATGSVVAIKADELNRGAVTSPQEMLQGKVPGVNILSGDGGPGSGASIRVRGGSSLNASNDPLIVIDGVPIGSDAAPGMSNALSTVNPADIESFTVLKDASATAIYGSRASNGVIIIQTKKGKGKKINVSYNGSFSVSKVYDKLEVLNGDEFRAYLPTLSNYAQISGIVGTQNTNWIDQIFQNAITHDHNVSIFGNVANKLPYRASVGYTSEEGTIKTSKLDRYTASIGVSPKFLNDHLTLNINAKGVYNKNTFVDGGGIVNNAAFFDPTQPMYFTDASGNVDRTYANGYWNWLTPSQDASGNPIFIKNKLANTNPLSLIYDQRNKNNARRFIGNAQIDYKVHGFEDLRLNVNVGIDIAKTRGDNGSYAGSYQVMGSNVVPLVMPGGSTQNVDLDGIGTYNKYTNFRRNQLFDAYANYTKEFGIHKIDAMVGYSWQWFYYYNTSFNYVNNSDRTVGGTNYSGYQQYTTSAYDPSDYALVSFFGRLNYTLLGRYLLTATFRRDGTSKFAYNKYGSFPSVALAWNIKDEPFLKDVASVNTLKLRLGWGITGQQDVGEYYPAISRYNLSSVQGSSYNMGGGNYVYMLMPQAANRDIKWESTTTWNAGLDFGFWNNFLTGNVDFYYRKTKDLLNYINPPLGTNFSNRVYANIGNMENKGVEIAFNLNPVRTQDWNIDLGFSGTFQRSKITKLTQSNEAGYKVTMGALSTGTGGYSQAHQVGYSPYTFYLFEQVYDKVGNPIQNAIVDRNGDGEITESDRYMTNKNPDPDFYYGINAKVRYRNWDFGFNAHGSFGNWMLNDFHASHASGILPGDQGYLRNITKFASTLGFGETSSIAQVYSDCFLENASFLKIDDITLGYTFKDVFYKGTSIRLAAGVQNVCTFTKYSGIDPEAVPGTNGIDHTMWSRPRIYSLRLNINF